MRSVIPIKQLGYILEAYEPSHRWLGLFSNPGPERIALLNVLINTKSKAKDTGQTWISKAALEHVIRLASKNPGGRNYRADLLNNPNVLDKHEKPGRQTGVSLMIQTIGRAFQSCDAQSDASRSPAVLTDSLSVRCSARTTPVTTESPMRSEQSEQSWTPTPLPPYSRRDGRDDSIPDLSSSLPPSQPASPTSRTDQPTLFVSHSGRASSSATTLVPQAQLRR